MADPELAADAAEDDAWGADAVLPVTVGTIAWAVAFVVLLFFRSDLVEHGTDWWLWVCVTGFAFGLIGIWWTRRRRTTYRAARRSPTPPS